MSVVCICGRVHCWDMGARAYTDPCWHLARALARADAARFPTAPRRTERIQEPPKA